MKKTDRNTGLVSTSNSDVEAAGSGTILRYNSTLAFGALDGSNGLVSSSNLASESEGRSTKMTHTTKVPPETEDRRTQLVSSTNSASGKKGSNKKKLVYTSNSDPSDPSDLRENKQNKMGKGEPTEGVGRGSSPSLILTHLNSAPARFLSATGSDKEAETEKDQTGTGSGEKEKTGDETEDSEYRPDPNITALFARVLRSGVSMAFTIEKGSEKGSQKGF